MDIPGICTLETTHIRLLRWIARDVAKEHNLPTIKRYWSKVYYQCFTVVNGLTIIQSPLKECYKKNCYHYMILEYGTQFNSSESCSKNAYYDFVKQGC